MPVCQFVIADPTLLADADLYLDRFKCGRPTRQGESWCEAHAAEVFSTAERRAEELEVWKRDPRNAA